MLADTLPLRWAYLGFQPIDLPGRTHFYVDLISALQDRKYFSVELEAQPLVLQNATNAEAKYSFDVSVVGDNVDPVNLRVFLDWKCDWNFEDRALLGAPKRSKSTAALLMHHKRLTMQDEIPRSNSQRTPRFD